MRGTETAAAEMMGAILLTVIIGSAIAMVGYQWLSQVPTASLPYANIEIACGNMSASPADPVLNDFSCRTGLINCTSESYDQCISKCSKYWTVGTDQYSQCSSLCGQGRNCVDATKYSDCNMLFICHTGGDPLLIREITILINGQDRGAIVTAQVFTFNLTSNDIFEAGEIIRYPLLAGDIPLKSVTLKYRDYQTGQQIVLGKKEFCCEPLY